MCDFFAACFLAPRPWVKRLWAQGMQDAGELAAVFNVSPAAMSWRLNELGMTSRRRWWGEGYGTQRTYFRKNHLAFVE
jgi:Zn-dependent peptidase ImmA (M78 family)